LAPRITKRHSPCGHVGTRAPIYEGSDKFWRPVRCHTKCVCVRILGPPHPLGPGRSGSGARVAFAACSAAGADASLGGALGDVLARGAGIDSPRRTPAKRVAMATASRCAAV
jgi:hypothetical protein